MYITIRNNKKPAHLHTTEPTHEILYILILDFLKFFLKFFFWRNKGHHQYPFHGVGSTTKLHRAFPNLALTSTQVSNPRPSGVWQHLNQLNEFAWGSPFPACTYSTMTFFFLVKWPNETWLFFIFGHFFIYIFIFIFIFILFFLLIFFSKKKFKNFKNFI
jgi:hypothetical protein